MELLESQKSSFSIIPVLKELINLYEIYQIISWGKHAITKKLKTYVIYYAHFPTLPIQNNVLLQVPVILF